MLESLAGQQKECSAVFSRLCSYAKQDHDIVALWLYGSRARNTARCESDYDLAVMFDRYIDDTLERRLRPEELALHWQQQLKHDLGWLVSISVLDIDEAGLPLAYSVICDNTLLWSCNDLRAIKKESEILSRWEIDYQYHVKHYV